MVAGCKCPGSCACKIKKPRKPKVKKAVVGGRVKQPQIVIQGMPPVSTTAIPQGHPYLTVTSDPGLKPKAKSTQTETQAQAEVKEEVKGEPLREQKFQKNKSVNPSRLLSEFPIKTPSQPQTATPAREEPFRTKETKEMGTETEPKKQKEAGISKRGFASFVEGFRQGREREAASRTKETKEMGTTTEAPTRMTTAAQTNLIEHVGIGTQATKETKEMGTETEPLLVNVAKGRQQDIFNIMKEQEATGKIVSLTGAGRPARPFNASLALASPSPSPVPVRVAPAPSIPVGSASSSEGVPGYTEVRPRTTEMRTLPTGVPGALYKITRPARVVQMPPEIIDLS